MSTAQTVGESKVWVGKVLYIVPDPVADELSRVLCEGERLKGEGELADKVIADFSCEGERKNAVIEQARKLLEGFRDSDNFFAFGDLEAAIVDLDSVSEGLKQK